MIYTKSVPHHLESTFLNWILFLFPTTKLVILLTLSTFLYIPLRTIECHSHSSYHHLLKSLTSLLYFFKTGPCFQWFTPKRLNLFPTFWPIYLSHLSHHWDDFAAGSLLSFLIYLFLVNFPFLLLHASELETYFLFQLFFWILFLASILLVPIFLWALPS